MSAHTTHAEIIRRARAAMYSAEVEACAIAAHEAYLSSLGPLHTTWGILTPQDRERWRDVVRVVARLVQEGEGT